MTDAPDMQAYLSDGADIATCHTRCTLYPGAGNDIIIPRNSTTIVKGFNKEEDIIDLTHLTNLKNYTQISYNFISANQSLILIFSGW